MENLCRFIQGKLFDIPSQPRSLLNDLEVCVGGIDTITSENASFAEISLSKEMIAMIGQWLGNEERIQMLISSIPVPDGFFGEQLCEQLVRDGMRDYLHLLLFSFYLDLISCHLSFQTCASFLEKLRSSPRKSSSINLFC